MEYTLDYFIANLSQAERDFCEEYEKNGGQGSKAYLAVKGNIKTESAEVGACRLLKKDDVRNYISYLQKQKYVGKILDIKERKELLTKIAMDDKIKAPDRIKAIECLNRMEGVYKASENEEKEEDKEKDITELDLSNTVYGRFLKSK